MFELVWFNIISRYSPTPSEITQDLEIAQSIQETIAQIAENTPYEFDHGAIKPATRRRKPTAPVSKPVEEFTPSKMSEHEDLYMSLGLSHTNRQGL